MLIVKPILIDTRKKKTNHSRGISLVFYDLHSQRYRRLILILLLISNVNS